MTSRDDLERALRSQKCIATARDYGPRMAALDNDPACGLAIARDLLRNVAFTGSPVVDAFTEQLPRPLVISSCDIMSALFTCFTLPANSEEVFQANYERFCTILVSHTVIEQRLDPVAIRQALRNDSETWKYPTIEHHQEVNVWECPGFQLFTSVYDTNDFHVYTDGHIWAAITGEPRPKQMPRYNRPVQFVGWRLSGYCSESAIKVLEKTLVRVCRSAWHDADRFGDDVMSVPRPESFSNWTEAGEADYAQPDGLEEQEEPTETFQQTECGEWQERTCGYPFAFIRQFLDWYFHPQPAKAKASLDSRLSNAVKLLVDADGDHISAVKLSLSIATVEALVGFKSGDGIKDEICRNVATILVENAHDRQKVIERVGDLYKIRCKCLHGEQTVAEDRQVEKARDLAGNVLYAILGWRQKHAREVGSFDKDGGLKELQGQIEDAKTAGKLFVGTPAAALLKADWFD